MKLELVSRDAEYSIYRNVRGELVYLADAPTLNIIDPPLYKIDADRLLGSGLFAGQDKLLRHEYSKALTKGWNNEQFKEFLGKVLSDPERVDEVNWCERCEMVTTPGAGGVKVNDGNHACARCARYYTTCGICKLMRMPSGSYAPNGRTQICEPCRDEIYSYCRTCGSYYAHELYNRDHMHGTGCCESPAPEFSIRYLDNPALVSDTKTAIALGAGKIDLAGYERIRSYLYSYGYRSESRLVADMDPTWQMKRGNWPKRFSTEIYKKLGSKLTPDVLAQVGTIGAEHSAKGEETVVMISRDLNRPAAFWFNGGSCWWTTAYDSRCALKTNGGFGILTFPTMRSKADGRAWVLPVKDAGGGYLAPTFETMDPLGFIVFNGYGKLEGYGGARLVAALAGMTYRKIGFADNPLYVNSGGFLIGREEFVAPYTDNVVHMRKMAPHATLYAEEQRANELVEAAKVRTAGVKNYVFAS